MRLTLALLALLAVFTAGCLNPDAWVAQVDASPITNLSCDETFPCPSNWQCVQFDNYTVPLCVKAEPCSFHKCPPGESCYTVPGTSPLQAACR